MRHLLERLWLWSEGLETDVRLAVRNLARTRGFTLVAVLSLAAGIGANTALFSVVHAVFFRPVPGVTGPDRVVELLLRTSDGTQPEWAYPDFADVQATDTPLQVVAGWKILEGNLDTADTGQRVRVMYASSGYFPALGVSVAHGRAFLSSEDVGPGQHPVVIISHHLWQDSLGGRADIVGQVITLNRTSYTVVGVAPQAFRHHRVEGGIDLWAPLTQHPAFAGPASYANDRAFFWLEVVGRLRPGATLGETNAALGTVSARLAQQYPATNRNRAGFAATFGPFPAANRTADTIAVGALLAFGGLVLLIICANLAGMMLARGATQERDAAIRVALGARRNRLVRALLVDAAVLAIGGGAAGIVTAWWFTRVAAFGAILGLPGTDLSPDVGVLVFSLWLVLMTALAVGLLPALKLSRPDVVGSLKDEVGTGSRRAGRFHRVAVSAQVGVTLLFLAVCGVFVEAMSQLDRRDLGFNPDRLLVVSLDLSTQGYDDPTAGLTFVERVQASAAAVPGVLSAAVADGLPIDLVGNFTGVSRGDGPDEPASQVQAEFTRVGPGFFPTIGTPMLLGRGIERTDTSSSARVVVIGRGLAERLWPGQDALGRQLRFGLADERNELFTVVGLTADVASSRPTEDWPQIFVPLAQHYNRPRLMLLVRGRSDAAALTHSIHSAIRRVDSRFVIPPAVTSASLLARSMEPQRTTAVSAGGLGLVALVLSAFGVYGLVAFVVSRRTREFGLRMALGASQGQILRAVLREGVWLTVPGLGIGALAAGGLTFAMQSMLMGVAPLNPVSFGLAALLIIGVVLLACAVPASRAASVDPAEALRSQ